MDFCHSRCFCVCRWRENVIKSSRVTHTHTYAHWLWALCERLSPPFYFEGLFEPTNVEWLWSILLYSAWKYVEGDTFTTDNEQKKIRIIHLITQQIQIYFDSNNNSCHWMIVSVHSMPMCEPIFFGLSDNYSHSAKALMCTCVQRWHIWFAWKENAFYGVTLWITTTTSATTKNRFTLTHDANF